MVVNKYLDNLQTYLDELKNVDLQDNNQFQSLLIKGMHLLSLCKEDIANLFAINRSSVGRWKDGKSFPHPLMRQGFFNQIEDIVREKILEECIFYGDSSVCSDDGCCLPVRALGLCLKHYNELYRVKKLAFEEGKTIPKNLIDARFYKARKSCKSARKTDKRGGGLCSVEGCRSANYAKGLCGKHFMKWVRSNGSKKKKR